MATTKFDKPVGTEISQLNSKISTAPVTDAASLSEVQSIISTFASNMAVYEVRYIIMSIYPASPPFAGTRYVMQVTKFDQSRIFVNAWRGNGTADYPIYGKYNDSAWTWDDLNSKMMTTTDVTISGNIPTDDEIKAASASFGYAVRYVRFKRSDGVIASFMIANCVGNSSFSGLLISYYGTNGTFQCIYQVGTTFVRKSISLV